MVQGQCKTAPAEFCESNSRTETNPRHFQFSLLYTFESYNIFKVYSQINRHVEMHWPMSNEDSNLF